MATIEITNDAIREVFAEELESLSGCVKDTFDSPRVLLLLRGLLPQVDEVAPKDQVRNGLALKATEDEIAVHPFIERKVCSNGSIMCLTVATRIIDRRSNDSSWAEVQIRQAIEVCSQPSVFSRNVFSIAQSVARPIDRALSLLRFFGSNLPGVGGAIMERVQNRLLDEDSTEFGLMNAITSVARDTQDQQMRWKLEELGGRIGLGLVHFPRQRESLKRVTAALAAREYA